MQGGNLEVDETLYEWCRSRAPKRRGRRRRVLRWQEERLKRTRNPIPRGCVRAARPGCGRGQARAQDHDKRRCGGSPEGPTRADCPGGHGCTEGSDSLSKDLREVAEGRGGDSHHSNGRGFG